MADQTNPYTQLGMMGMMTPNPYTQYGGKPLPIPGYMGTPTDAQGNPIQSYTDAANQHAAWDAANPTPAAGGMTLNSTPNSAPQQLQRTYLGQGTGGAAGGENAQGSGGTPGGQAAGGYAIPPTRRNPRRKPPRRKPPRLRTPSTCGKPTSLRCLTPAR